MSEDDAIIQAVAQALRSSRVGWDTSGIEPETEDVADAKAAIAAYLGSLEAAGWAVVPKVATPDMRDADLCSHTPSVTWGYMVAASPKPPGLGD